MKLPGRPSNRRHRRKSGIPIGFRQIFPDSRRSGGDFGAASRARQNGRNRPEKGISSVWNGNCYSFVFERIEKSFGVNHLKGGTNQDVVLGVTISNCCSGGGLSRFWRNRLGLGRNRKGSLFHLPDHLCGQLDYGTWDAPASMNVRL